MKKIDYYSTIAIFIILWIDYIPYKLSAISANPEKFEYVIYSISLAYIASYIFYYINNYLPKKQNAKIIKKVINNNVLYLIENRKRLYEVKEVVVNEMTKINVNGKSLTVAEFLEQNYKYVHKNLDSILTIQD